MSEPVLVTGAAGFIGFHVATRLLAEGKSVVGVDNLSAYYDPSLKRARLALLEQHSAFRFVRLDLANHDEVARLFDSRGFKEVVHLAAQPGVRYSLEEPLIYVKSNVNGFLSVLEACRHAGVTHLVFASSSSVYGANTRMPFSEHDETAHPISLYAATKKANEMMAHSYAHLFELPCTGLRFFTVYGPWGRPDMALFSFTRKILAGEPIELFSEGRVRRDFTYIDDVVSAVVSLLPKAPRGNPLWRSDEPDAATSAAPYRIYNVGNSEPVEVRELVRELEQALGRKAIVRLVPMQPGDVAGTYANTVDLETEMGGRVHTTLHEGVRRFVAWYRTFSSEPETRAVVCADGE